MDHVPAGETDSDVTHARRKRMRAHARGLRAGTPPEVEGFQTPEWLDRSFVLPLTEPDMSDVPSQSVRHHDDYQTDVAPRQTPDSETAATPVFVRPPTNEIDFARVIRRADLGRTASRSALGSIALAGLLLIAYLLTSSSILLGMAISFALVTVIAVGVRVRLATAPIPHL